MQFQRRHNHLFPTPAPSGISTTLRLAYGPLASLPSFRQQQRGPYHPV